MLDRSLVEDVLTVARRRGGAFAEVFVEETTGTSIRLDDGKVEELTTGLDRGAGVRVTHGTSYGYAFSNRLDRDALIEAAEAASAALRGGEAGSVVDLRTLEGPLTNAVERPASDVPAADKVAALRDEEAIVPWFYRVLRNAVIDHHRRKGAATKALEGFAAELETAQAGTETHGAVCACVAKLTETLKPELRRFYRLPQTSKIEHIEST